jgi:hypothetical protein
MELLTQLEITIKALKDKRELAPEPIVLEYIKKYENAFNCIKRATEYTEAERHKLIGKLLNCARGYMETSSNYNQAFLNEMGKTENLIKNLKQSQYKI